MRTGWNAVLGLCIGGALLLCGCPRPSAATWNANGGLECAGQGDAVVVFIAGASRHASDWDAVRARLGAMQTCAWEPPASGTRTADHDAALLVHEGRGLGRRWIVVGHSYGGLVARVVAAQAPDLTAGVVFVDSVQEDAFDATKAVPVSSQQRIDWASSFSAAVAAGIPRDVPVIALVADHRSEAGWNEWLASQRKLIAGGVPGAVQVVEHSGHMIPRDRPDAVADAIHEIQRVRAR